VLVPFEWFKRETKVEAVAYDYVLVLWVDESAVDKELASFLVRLMRLLRFTLGDTFAHSLDFRLLDRRLPQDSWSSSRTQAKCSSG